MTDNVTGKLIKHSSIAAIDALIAQAPQLLPIWVIMKGFFGAAAELRVERALEYLEIFRDMPQIIIDNPYFQDGIINLVPHYLSQRNMRKRQIVNVLIKEYSKSSDWENFELERFDQVIHTISLQALTFLEQHRSNVINDYLCKCKDEAMRLEKTPEQIERWTTINLNSGIPFSSFYDDYISKNFGLDSEAFRTTQVGSEEDKRPGLEKFGRQETEMGYSATDIFNELVGLGVMKLKVEGGGTIGGGGGFAKYYFTEFGRKFLELLNQ